MVLERIQRALLFWWKSFLPILAVSAPFAILGTAAELLLGPLMQTDGDKLTGISLPTTAVMLLVQVCGQGALICQLASLSRGQTRKLSDCLIFSVYLFPALALCMFVITLPLAFSIMLAVIAAHGAGEALLFLFLMPGMWAYMRFSLAIFYTALERRPVSRAVFASIDKTRPIQWPLLLSWLLTMLFMIIIASTINLSLLSILGDHGGSLLLTNIVQKMLGAVGTVLLFQAWLEKPQAARQ